LVNQYCSCVENFAGSVKIWAAAIRSNNSNSKHLFELKKKTTIVMPLLPTIA
jgi:hypothetical protein